MPEKKRPELHAMVREQFVKNFKAIPSEIGQTLGAMFRAGLKDLQTVVLHAFPQQAVASHEEPGMPYMPPQYEPPLYNQRENDRLTDPPAPIVGHKVEKGVER